MSHRSRAIFLFLTIVAVLFVSAVGTTNAYADDGTPPSPPTEETSVVDPSTGEAEPVATEPAVVVPPTDEVVPVATEVPVTETPIVEEQPAAEAPAAEEQKPAEPVAEAESILEQVPDDTTVTVLNAEGKPQPLTSQASAEAILASDPVWCPGGALPGSEGCTESFSSFTALLNFLKLHEGEAAYQQEGTIYVEMGAYAGGESSIDFNTYNFTSLNNYNLTVQGGWDPSNNDTSATSQLNVPIIIGTSANPWVGSLTLNNIGISNVSNQTGLTLYSNMDVTLSNVTVTNSQGGADLNAGRDVSIDASKFNGNQQFGAKVNAGRLAYITDSEFNNNAVSKDAYDGYGLDVDAKGEVFLDSVYAKYNEKFGADITSNDSVVVMNSFFSGNISYTHNCSKNVKGCHSCTETANGGYGLQIVTPSIAYLSAVEANENYLFGAHVEALEAQIYNSSFNLNGSGEVSKPTGYGLEVLTTGGTGVTLDGVHADNNQLFGANVTAGDNGVTINKSFFDGNKSYYKSCSYQAKESCHDYVCTKTYYGYGLQVVTTGNVKLATVSASNNYLFGAHLEGKSVSIFGGTFNGNASDSTSNLTGKGLEIISTVDTSLSDVKANNNQLFGADILAAANVNIVLSTFNGQQVFSGTKVVGGGYGLQVITTGTASQINLSGVAASDNYLYGMHLVAASVKISGNGSTYSSAERNKEGIKIESAGIVLLDKVIASNNKRFGATILSGTNEALDGTVFISNSFFSGNASYTSNCKGKTFYGYGLKVITTSDDISLINVEANDNYLYGAQLQGASIDVSQSVFNSNGTDNQGDHVGKGLKIISTGLFETVRLTNVTANNNQLYGANIEAEGLVSVSNSFFSGNQSYTSNCKCKVYDGYGLRVVTTSDVFLGNVTANENYLYGTHVEGANVSVYDSFFNKNGSPIQKGQLPTGKGLEVVSSGDTYLNGVQANDNQLFGAKVEAGGEVEVVSSVFARNKYTYSCGCKDKTGGYGLKVVAAGPITIGGSTASKAVQAFENGAEGTILEGETTVVVSNSQFNNNGSHGLVVEANGDITLNNVTATWNKGNGVKLTGICTNTAYVNGGTFANNGKHGIKLIDIIYVPDGMQVFGGNSSTDVSQNPCGSDGGGSSGGGSGGSGGGGCTCGKGC